MGKQWQQWTGAIAPLLPARDAPGTHPALMLRTAPSYTAPARVFTQLVHLGSPTLH